jgi:hypothetical protein
VFQWLQVLITNTKQFIELLLMSLTWILIRGSVTVNYLNYNFCHERSIDKMLWTYTYKSFLCLSSWSDKILYSHSKVCRWLKYLDSISVIGGVTIGILSKQTALQRCHFSHCLLDVDKPRICPAGWPVRKFNMFGSTTHKNCREKSSQWKMICQSMGEGDGHNNCINLSTYPLSPCYNILP